MAKKRKKAARGVDARVRQARRIFDKLPDGAQSGTVYLDILLECDVPKDDARRLAGLWMLDRAREKPT